jgi:Methyltransferase domain
MEVENSESSKRDVPTWDRWIQIHQTNFSDQIGTLEPHEMAWLGAIIAERKPNIFLEIGVASGLTTAIVRGFLSAIGSGRIIGVDIDSKFYADQTKPVGYFVEQLADEHCTASVDLRFPATASSVPGLLQVGEKIDLALIDGDHQHPWPTLDLLALLPVMNEVCSGIFLHDINLYRGFHQKETYSCPDLQTEIGPKFLIDQFPDTVCKLIDCERPNLALIDTKGDFKNFIDPICAALFIPWRLRSRIAFSYLAGLRDHVRGFWGPEVLRVFERAVDKFG